MGIWSIVHSSVPYQYNHLAINWSEERKGKRVLGIFSVVSRSDQISPATSSIQHNKTKKQ